MNRPSRLGLVHLGLAAFALALIVRAANVQLAQGRAWRAKAARQQFTEKPAPAPRGAILDASGLVLAESHEVVQLEVAPREVKKPDELRRALTAAHVPPDWIARALDTKRAWVTLPGRYLAVDVAGAMSLRGVHPTSATIRSYATSDAMRRLVGRVDADGKAQDGLELALDSLLRGTAGARTLVRDAHGRSFESPTAPGVAATPGNTVVLTIRRELQEIVEHALDDAVQKMDAEGGDIVVLDPRTGDVLAMASQRRDERTAATAMSEPFEPGSTMKPFMAAALMQLGRARLTDSVDTGNGVLDLNGRQIHDEERIGRAPLADVIKYSSNVGIVKFASRFSKREEYEAMRDFGFGTPTGVPYPAESQGILRDPHKWSLQSPASLAMGYEVAVTPLQLAAAYAALANGGELLEPALVKEIRDPQGHVLYTHGRRVVRRVLSPKVADAVRTMMIGVVEQGTAVKADLANYLLAGKTGTPRRAVNGRYVQQEYNPNFVGLFPADAPQYVIVVKITNPHGTFYGGTTAAPVTRTILEAAIAARDAALDRGKLASSAQEAAARAPKRDSTRMLALQQGRADAESLPPRPAPVADADTGSVPYVVQLPVKPERRVATVVPRAVPDVHGLALRDAVRSLHRAGFRVQLVRGHDTATAPAAGTFAIPGATVRLLYPF